MPTAVCRDQAGYVLTLTALVAALSLVLFWPTLGNEYAYDDIDYLNQAADAMAGKTGLFETLFRPQGEHLVAGMRLALHVSASLFGADALPFRLLALMAHVGAAMAVGLLACRYAGRVAGAAAPFAYVLPCGFSSMWIWFPSGASLPFGMLFLTVAAVLISSRETIGRRLASVLAGGGVVLALVCETTLAPLVLLPAAVYEYERWRRGHRLPGAFTLFSLLAAVAMGLLASWLYRSTFGQGVSVSLLHGLPRGAFLLLVAPFRYVFPGVPVLASEPGLRTAVLGSLLGLATLAPVAAVLLGLWRSTLPRLVVVAMLCAIGPVGFVVLVGLGRSRFTYWELYEGDRYFFPLLVPVSLLVGAAASTVASHLRTWSVRHRLALAAIVTVMLGAELVLHRRAMLGRVPFQIYAAHERRFIELERLSTRLSEAALALPPDSQPLRFPDGKLWFPDVHNGYLSAVFQMYVIGHHAGTRLELGEEQVGVRDQRILNPLLESWAREIGEPLPYLSIVDGRLANAHLISLADFRTGPEEGAVVAGFYDWEGSSRWMGARGELLLTITSPSLTLRLAAPMEYLKRAGVETIGLQVSAVDEATGITVPFGGLRVTTPGVSQYRLSTSPLLSRLGNGRVVRLIIESDRTWKPSAVLPGSIDTRDLSVQFFSAGCE